MNTYTQILREYETAFRDLVTFKNLSTTKKVKEAIRLNKSEDWSFICTALDVIGDTTQAINNFLEFGLEGNTDGNDPGEKYLRLYGVLNATYLQQFALVNLYKKSNLFKPKDVIKKMEKLEIYNLRNKLGAHSNDYENDQGILESYVIIQISLKGYLFEYMNNDTSEREWVNLKKCLEEHLRLAIDLLDKVYDKSIKTIHKGEDSKKEEHLNILSKLRKLKKEMLTNQLY